MADSRGGRQIWLRGAFVLVLLSLVGVLAGPVGQASAARRAPLPVPNAFRLQGSNGYTFYVISEPPRKGTHGTLRVGAVAKGEEVTYAVPATLTETSIQANLGVLGEISVTFQRSGKATTIPCGDQVIRVDSGSYVGTIAFHGEEGFTSVDATTVPGDISFLAAGECGQGLVEGSSGRGKGAELGVRNPGLGPRLFVASSRPGAPAEIVARLSEYENGISIERATSRRIPGADFTYDTDLGTATVDPPAPFSGSARFDQRLKAGRRWSGDLAVDMPGRAAVPLTGPLLRAALFSSR